MPESSQRLSQPSPRSPSQDHQAPHWAIQVLLTPRLDLDGMVRDVESEGLPDWVESAYEALDCMTLGSGQIPTWLPHKWYDLDLSPDQRLAWFDELMRSYYPFSEEWPPPTDPNVAARLVLRSLLLMYHDRLTGALPGPSFIPVQD
jgi:hypothetical protein